MAKKKKKKNTKLRLFFTIIFALIVVVLISLIAAQRLGNMTISAIASETKAYFMSFGAGDGFPYEIDSSDVKNIVVNNSNLFMLLENESKVITPTAKEIYNSEHRYTDPVMKNNGSKTIIYDLSSGKYQVQAGYDVLVEKELKYNIISADIGKKGNYAIGSYAEDAQSVLTVYSNNKKEQFKRKFISERIIDISLSDNGRFAAVAVVEAKSAEISSKLYIFNFSSDKPVKVFDYPATTILKVDYLSGGNIVVLGDNLRSYIKNNTTRCDDIKFNSDTIHNYSIDESGVSTVVLSKYGSESLSNLSVYSKSNKKLCCFDIQNDVKWVDCDKNFIAVLTDSGVKTYNKKGKNIGNIKFNGEPVRVTVDGMKTYVLTTAGLKCFNTKGTTDERQNGND